MKAHVESGIDHIGLADGVLKAARVGLMTNPTGVDHDLRSTIDIVNERYHLTALLACEHGVRGDQQAGAHVDTAVDGDTGVTVYSTYGAKDQRLTKEMLDAFDVMVFDIQDVGARFYTYLYSLSYAMEECAKAHKPVVVLDRVNPLGGIKTSGTILDRKFASFVGDYELPTQYGLTIAEYARYVKHYLNLDLELTTVPLTGWRRELLLDDTDLGWVAPSPNCQSLATALCYIGTCLFEGTNLSEGRGTTQPFELIGAPYIDGAQLEKRMNDMALPGVRFRRVTFVPTFSKHQGVPCHGVQMHVTDRNAYNAFDAGLYLLDAVREIYPKEFEFIRWSPNTAPAIDRLMGTDEYSSGKLSAKQLIEKYRPRVNDFVASTKQFRLYE